jgi:hypothetical protein
MDYIELRSFDNYIEANIIMNMLQSQSIVCHLKDEHIITIDPFLSPAIGGMKLMVHHSQLERAWELMDQAEAQYLRSRSCPICKSHQLSIETVHKKHRCRLAALVNMMLRGQSLEITKLYRCGQCGYDFKELP